MIPEKEYMNRIDVPVIDTGAGKLKLGRYVYMSQEKVNKYKEYKKNKKQILAKQKKKKALDKILVGAVCAVVVLGLVAALGVTFRNMYRDYLASIPDYQVSGYVLDDLTGILAETETESETVTE